MNDLTGQRFGKLTVIERASKPEGVKGTAIYWLCKCDCGNEKIIRGSNLRNGMTQSCGCLIIKNGRERNRDNKTGEKGVYFLRAKNKYTAQISYNKITYCLGLFPDLESAIAARKEAEKLLFEPLLNQ